MDDATELSESVTNMLKVYLLDDYDRYIEAMTHAQRGTLEQYVRTEWFRFPTDMRLHVGADLSLVNWNALEGALAS